MLFHPLHRALRALTAGLLCCGILAAAPFPAFAETFFEEPDAVVISGGRLTLSGTMPGGMKEGVPAVWVLALPEGELEPRIEKLTLRQKSGVETMTLDSPEAVRKSVNRSDLERALEVTELGVMRRARLAAVRLPAGSSVRAGGERWTIESFTVSMSAPDDAGRSISDSGFAEADAPLRRLLETAVSNPEMLEKWAVETSPLPEGEDHWQPRPELSPDFPWLRIPVSEQDIYAIDARWLNSAGVDPGSVEPGDLMLVSRGEPVGLLQTGPEEAGFKGGARLIFSGSPSESPETRERVYWLGRRTAGRTDESITRAPEVDPQDAELRATWMRRWRVEEDNSLQTKLGSFLSVREMNWVWEQLEPGTPVEIGFELSGLPTPPPELQGRIHLYLPSSGLPSGITLAVWINGEPVVPGAAISRLNGAVEFDVPAGLMRVGRNTMTLRMDVPPALAGRALPPVWLDAAEFDGPSLLRGQDGALTADFALEEMAAEQPAILEAVGFRPYRVLAFDLSDPENPAQLPVSVEGDIARISTTLRPESRIRIVESDAVPRAPDAEASAWRDWTRTDYSADAVIIHHQDFAETAERLAEQYEAIGHEVMTVDVASIYDALSHGELSTDAIRAFLKRAVHTWEGRRPSYALLVGDCTSDGRRISRNDVVNYVPTRTLQGSVVGGDQFASDSWYSWLTEGDEIADIIVARVSVNNTEDAGVIVEKTAEYRALKAQPWAARLVNITDDGDFTEVAAEMLRTSLAGWVDQEWHAASLFPWEDNFYLPKELTQGSDSKVSPTMTNRIERAFNEGTGIMTWFGHGSPNIWSNQRIWFGGDSENSDNLRLANRDRLPFIATFTCNNGAIDYPMPRWNVTIIEDMLRVPDGGAIAAYVPSGPGYPRQHLVLAEGLTRAFSEFGVRDFGTLSEFSRLNYQARLGNDDHSRMYVLLGDPTLQLPVPQILDEPTVEPRVLRAGFAEQAIVVSVGAPVEMASAEAVLQDLYGSELARAVMTRTGDRFTARMDVQLPAGSDRFQVVVSGSDANGEEFWQSGRWVERLPAHVVITNYEIVERTPELNLVSVEWTLENRSASRATGYLRLEYPGESRAAHGTSWTLEPWETAAVRTPVQGSEHVQTVLATVSPARPHQENQRLPSTRIAVPFMVTEPGVDPDMAIDSSAFQVLPATPGSGQPRAQVFIGNAGPEPVTAGVYWKLTYPDGREVSGERNAGRLASGEVTEVLIPMQMELEMVADVQVEMLGTMIHPDDIANDSNPRNNRLEHTLGPADLPDLNFVPETLELRPRNPTEGATVFVVGAVQNSGAQRSGPTRVELYAEDDTELTRPLTSLTDQTAWDIPPLDPGESHPFAVRWDPSNNRNVNAIRVVVDGPGTLVEPNRENNAETLPIDVRTSWELEPVGIRPARSDKADTLRLVAAVRNSGETDARRVAVFFYSSLEQNDETFIGESIVERVPAGQTVEVPFDWDLSTTSLSEMPQVSFAIAIKGSLQRTSSVSEE